MRLLSSSKSVSLGSGVAVPSSVPAYSPCLCDELLDVEVFVVFPSRIMMTRRRFVGGCEVPEAVDVGVGVLTLLGLGVKVLGLTELGAKVLELLELGAEMLELLGLGAEVLELLLLTSLYTLGIDRSRFFCAFMKPLM